MTSVALGLPLLRRSTAEDGELGPPRPDDPRLIDRFGRVAADLRVSLTDRCNLRCSYCMPAEGLDWMVDEKLLTDDEVIRLITIAVQRLGVAAVRFTGGEPLLRKGLDRIIAATTRLQTSNGGQVTTALTTNALGLERRAAALAVAGLGRVNVSLDTLDAARFAEITHRDRFHDVLAGLRAATVAGLAPVKVNAMLMRGVNDDEAAAMLGWALNHGYELRFIEQMPLDPHGAWDRAEMVTADEILSSLQQEFTLIPTGPVVRGAAPAETWRVRDAASGRETTVGIIASVTRPFCGDCDRTRLTADGQVRNCLFANGETDLRALLRGDAGDEDIADRWRSAMWGKQAGHGIDDPSFLHPTRPMSAIGG